MAYLERMFGYVFGLFLVAVGVYALFALVGFWALFVGAVILGLGANLIYATHYKKRSWLSWIGPLP